MESIDIQMVDVKLIDVPKTTAAIRTFDKDFAIGLADSITKDGQQMPIILRPNHDHQGRFLLVAGRHRLFAIKNVLKRTHIEAKVDVTMTSKEAEEATTVENLWRSNLSKAQHAAAIKRWHDGWVKKLPPVPEKTKKKPVETPEESPTLNSSDHDDQNKTRVEVAVIPTRKQEKEFNQKVAAITGQAEISVRRAKAIGKAFTADQLEIFSQMDCSQVDMLTISKIKDEKKRAEVINLIATGLMVPDDAIKQIMGTNAPEKFNQSSPSQQSAKVKKETKSERAPELSDSDWFEQNCAEKAAMFGDPAKYKSDALMFRHVTEARHVFRLKIKKILADQKKDGNPGSWANLVNRVLSISHPKDWLICPTCRGVGSRAVEDNDGLATGHPTQCRNCNGGGYHVKNEVYY